MPTPHPAPDTPLPAPTAGDATGIERQRTKLDRLGDLALELTEILMQKARGADGEADLERITLAFSRAARAVRQTVALHARLAQTLQAVEKAQRALDSGQRYAETFTRTDEAAARKRTILHVVARVAGDDENLDEVEALDLVSDCRERLEDESLLDVLDRPVSETIADICRSLGLSPDWDALAGEAWAQKEIGGGAVGAPLAAIAERMVAAPAVRRSARRGTLPPARPRGASPTVALSAVRAASP